MSYVETDAGITRRDSSAHLPLGAPKAAQLARRATVLGISPLAADHAFLEDLFRNTDLELRAVSTRCEALPWLRDESVAAVICERELPDGSWKDILKELARLDHPPQLVVSSRLADEYLWAEVLNLGGYDVLVKPFDPAEVIRVIGFAWRQRLSARRVEQRGAQVREANWAA